MLNAGTKLGAYEIVAALGAGGMGEVYRSRDTKLNRDVAIKVLPPSFSGDPERVARFEREAQLLAALNHPHIAAIHGLEEANGAQFLVLELVEGETLAERLAHGSGLMAQGGSRLTAQGLSQHEPSALSPKPIPISEALDLARQIADALEAAHEKGIIHRDLKPANIALTADGQVKVLDFGLAKALEPEGASDPSHSPTLTMRATQAGVILGTAAYMSPEQARGRAADKRTDIWAFGCVLYEMLTGKRAFEGEDVTDTIAAVVRGEPDWSALPKDVPPQIELLIRRCLVKDRKQRISDIGVAKFLMTETIAPPAAAPATVGVALQPLPRRRVTLERTAWLIAGIVLTAVAGWTAMRLMADPPPRPMRFTIVPPQPIALNTATDRDIAITPDGSHIVFRIGTPAQNQMVVRAIDQLEARPLAGITGAGPGAPRLPFVSPDGRWIGFFAGSEIKKVSITGGPPISLCRYTGAPRGASWGPDDTIIFATAEPGSGLLRVPAGGGDPVALTKPDTARGEGDHLFPSILPDGRAVLFTIVPSISTFATENAQVGILDLETGERKTLIRGGSHGEYVETGHLVYAAAGTLRAVRFDPRRLEVTGDPVPVVEHVMMAPTGAANFAVSRSGTLIFVPGGAGGQAGASRSLVWVDRQGREEPIKVPPRAYLRPRLSPDGTRVALDVGDQENDVWVWDLARETLTRLTFDPGQDMYAVWTPDSRRVIFTSARAGALNLYWQAADNTGTVERLTTSPNPQFATSSTPDGARIVMYETTQRLPDIGVLTLDRAQAPSPVVSPSTALGSTSSTAAVASAGRVDLIVQTPFVEIGGDLSPDGRWLAYQSNESGEFQIYVRPFPNVDAGRWQISTGGGTRPIWARNGRELFYLDRTNALTVVQVQTKGSTFSAGNPSKLFESRYFNGSGGRTYDVSADGQRFLMIKDTAAGDQQTAPPASITVVVDWVEELKQRVGSRQSSVVSRQSQSSVASLSRQSGGSSRSGRPREQKS